ncbi:MAG: hypothetical protein J1E38_03110 [Paramuribaculum sp.]|nr:hypothetical protein [Paramuribaculum sp.]
MKLRTLISALAISLLAIGFSTADINAQKRSSHRSGGKTHRTSQTTHTTSSLLSISTFCQNLIKEKGWNSYGISRALATKLQGIKSSEEIEENLKKLGFECISKETKKEYDDMAEYYYDKIVATYVKQTDDGQIKISQDSWDYTIQFPTAAQKDSFMKTVTSAGYKGNGDGDYSVPGNEEAYWVGISIRVEGNQVMIRPHAG